MPHAGRSRTATLAEICAAFLKLGSIAFGGPVAHLGYLRLEFVHRRRWLDDEQYADLVALCQLLPGPASSQVVFGLGMRRGGIVGGLIASVMFLLPSAVLMIAFGYGMLAAGNLQALPWLHGIKLGALAVVAQAVWAMGRTLCPDRARQSLCLAAAAAVLLLPGASFQIGIIVMGGLAGWVIDRHAPPARVPPTRPSWRAHGPAVAALVAFALLLIAPMLVWTPLPRPAALLTAFYRAGALVFGGGHVVLPLLRAELVPPGWISDSAFLAGYGVAQAVPGPLFSFAGYLGTVIARGPLAWVTGAACLVAIFLPGWLLVSGALPFWDRLRVRPWLQAALRGANAAVVGVLLAALYQPIFVESVRSPRDLAAAFVAFLLLQFWRTPPWVVVPLMAALGQWAPR
jgi:chromate transporter